MKENILILGGTGNIGSLLVDQLLERGVSVRLGVRPSSISKVKARLGVSLVDFDFTEPSRYAGSFKGIHSAFLLLPASPALEKMARETLAIAEGANVKHVVKISAMGAGKDAPFAFGRWHGAADEALIQSGLSYTLLRPSSFFQNFVVSYSRTIKRDSAFYASTGNATIPYVDCRDIAASAAAALTDRSFANRIYDLTGPESLSHSDIAARLSALLGREVRFLSPPDEAMEQSLLTAGLPPFLAKGLVELYAYYRAHSPAATDDVERLTGRTPVSFNEFAATFLSAIG